MRVQFYVEGLTAARLRALGMEVVAVLPGIAVLVRGPITAALDRLWGSEAIWWPA